MALRAFRTPHVLLAAKCCHRDRSGKRTLGSRSGIERKAIEKAGNSKEFRIGLQGVKKTKINDAKPKN